MTLGLFNLSGKDLEDNLGLIRRTLEDYSCRLYLFGEGFLQGPDYPSFDYEKDIYRTISSSSIEIAGLRKLSKDKGVALGFGYFENVSGGIYNSYMVIDRGQVIFENSAVSRGWMKKDAHADYRQGKALKSFKLEGRRFLPVLGFDFFLEDLLIWLVEYDDRVDYFIWLDRSNLEEFIERSQIFARQTLSLRRDGAYQLSLGKVLSQNEKALLVDI